LKVFLLIVGIVAVGMGLFFWQRLRRFSATTQHYMDPLMVDPLRVLTGDPSKKGASAQGQAAITTLHCPKCDRVVYSRRNKVCGFCGAELPAHFCFSEAELADLAKEEAAAEERRKAKELAEEQKKRKRGDSPPMEL